MNILGIHMFGHDTGISLFEGSRLIFSIETERLTRIKEDSNVKVALEYTAARYAEFFSAVDLVVVPCPDSRTEEYRDQNILDIERVDDAILRIKAGDPHFITTCLLGNRVVDCLIVAHEASHAALAWHAADFRDPCVVLVNEGAGSFSRCSIYHFSGGQITLAEWNMLPWYASGGAWDALGTLVLNLAPVFHPVAGKVMALSAFGRPNDRDRQLILDIDPSVGDHHYTDMGARSAAISIIDRIMERPGIDGVGDFVATFQDMVSSAIGDCIAQQVKDAPSSAVALGGGCALNVITNSYLRTHITPNIYIAPPCNDSGQALGAGVYGIKLYCGLPVDRFSVYSNGGELSSEEAATAFKSAHMAISPFDPRTVANLLADGCVVAYAKGISEVGPRALGHRSLLADPTVDGMKVRVSEEIKRREWFRPLAPVMRAETFRRMFPGQMESPHMLFSYHVPPTTFPEATHVDSSARIQTVTAPDNSELHAVLQEFEQLTGVPALINTSLNAKGRSIACQAGDIFDDFLDRDVDVFVMGDLIGSRSLSKARLPARSKIEYPWMNRRSP